MVENHKGQDKNRTTNGGSGKKSDFGELQTPVFAYKHANRKKWLAVCLFCLQPLKYTIELNYKQKFSISLALYK
jgi:hypothetical protein